MFTSEDLFKVIDYLRGLNPQDLDSTIKAIASGDKSKVEYLFTKVIDIPAYSSNDYLMLRAFIIDWYSSLRTLCTVSQKSTDIYSMSSSNIDELFRSFGYKYSEQILSKNQKVNFFLDLVNLYKKKGSPQSIFRALQYHGISRIELAEIWLMKSRYGDLVFRGRKLLPEPESLRNSSFGEIPFYKLTFKDPHWTQSKNEILLLEKKNLIKLPSITPYFGIKTSISLVLEKISYCLIERVFQDEYYNWINNNIIPSKTILVDSLGGVVSLLELLLATIETANRYWNRNPNTGNFFECYNQSELPPNRTIEEILTEYKQYITTRSNTRQEIKDWYQLGKDRYTRNQSDNFLSNAVDVSNILQILNPNILDLIDSYESTNKLRTLLLELVSYIDTWIANNLSIDYSYLLVQVFGNEMLDHLHNVLNFFKPYRSRFIDFGTHYLGYDQFLCDDKLYQKIYLNFSDDVVIPYYDSGHFYDHRMPLIGDLLKFVIHINFSDRVIQSYEDFDYNNIFDDIGILDFIQTKIHNKLESSISVNDKISLIYNISFNDYVTEDKYFDENNIFDARFPFIDDDIKIIPRVSFNDRVIESKQGYDNNEEFDYTAILDFINKVIKVNIIDNIEVRDKLNNHIYHIYNTKEYNDELLDFDNDSYFDVELSGPNKDMISINIKNGYSYFYDYDWILNHSYNTYSVICECYDINKYKIYNKEIELLNLNESKASFNNATEGNFIIINSDTFYETSLLSSVYDNTTSLYKWEIQHNLSTTDIFITCTDENRIILNPVSIEVNSPNDITVWFNTNQNGYCSVLTSNNSDKISSTIVTNSNILNIQHNLQSLRVINKVYDITSTPYILVESNIERIVDENNVYIVMNNNSNYKIVTMKRS